jgi:hypothetical protein
MLQKKKVGRKLHWKAGQTELIRIPKVFVEQALAYVRQLDNGLIPDEPIAPIAPQPSSTSEIDYYRLLLDVKNTMSEIQLTATAIERLEKVKTDLEDSLNEVRQLKQQHRESQKQIREREDELLTLQQKSQDLEKKLTNSNLELEKSLAKIASLKAENDKLRLFRSESGESEQLVTEILELIHNTSSSNVKIYIKSIYSLSQSEPIERVRMALKVMASNKEGETTYNNCCRKAATRLLAGELDGMTFEVIMKEVSTESNERNERNERNYF